MRVRRVVAFIAAGLPLALLGIAGGAKLIDTPEFARSLEDWQFIPPQSIPLISVAIPATEIFLAGAWLIGWRRPLCIALSIGLIAVFTVALVAHMALATAPDCGCLGLILQHEQSLASAEAGLVRNMTMIALLATALIAKPRPSSQEAGRRAPVSRREGSAVCRAGFTLIETILVVIIIALLLFLIAPSLTGARTAARRTASLAQLRSHAAVFATYGIDWADSLPYFTDPGATKTIVRYGRGGALALGFFEAHFAWNYPLADGYYDGQRHQGSFFVPTPWRGSSPFTDYYYPCAFIARPEYWRTPTRRDDGSQLRSTRFAEVHYPSRKSLLVARWPLLEMAEQSGVLGQPWHSTDFAAVDGSARSYQLSEIRPGEPTGDGSNAPGALHVVDFPPAMHTWGGVQGWDFP